MKTHVEISQQQANNSLDTHAMNLHPSIHALRHQAKGMSTKKRLTLAALLLASLALYLGCSLFSLILIALFTIFLGVLINEFVQFIRFIRDLE